MAPLTLAQVRVVDGIVSAGLRLSCEYGQWAVSQGKSGPSGEGVMRIGRRLGSALLLAALLSAGPAALAQKQYGPGVSDGEIRIGQTMPYSGPASAYGTIGRAELAYFAGINRSGGVNGRKITLLSLDDSLSPPKTVEQTRKLVEQENVLLMFSTLGTPTSMAVRKYLNERQVPQLFVASGAAAWGDWEHYPWTMGWQPNYQTEARIYAKYLLENRPDARIALLYQDDDYGKDYLKGLRDGLGERADKMLVAVATYETSDPSIDSQVAALEGSGADVFFNGGTPKFGAQAIRKAYDLGWHPLQLLASVSTSVSAVLAPAGLEKAKDIISIGYLKDPTDPQWQEDPGFRDWLAFMRQDYPEGSIADNYNVSGYSLAQTLVEVLRRCGDDLSRIRIKTAPDDFRPLKGDAPRALQRPDLDALHPRHQRLAMTVRALEPPTLTLPLKGGGEFSATAPPSPSPLVGEGGVGGRQQARRSWPSA
jgi:branched-chain amino acid transport system substrate-binding protein